MRVFWVFIRRCSVGQSKARSSHSKTLFILLKWRRMICWAVSRKCWAWNLYTFSMVNCRIQAADNGPDWKLPSQSIPWLSYNRVMNQPPLKSVKGEILAPDCFHMQWEIYIQSSVQWLTGIFGSLLTRHRRGKQGNVWDCCDHTCFAQRGKAPILLCIRKTSRDIRRLDTDTEILLFTFYTHIIKTITVL